MVDEFDIKQFLKSAVASGASDEHLMVGQPPYIRKNGFMKKVNMPELQRVQISDALVTIAPSTILQQFNTHKDIDFIYELKGCSRFRVNYSRRLGNPAVVIRNIPYEIPTITDLMLPDVLRVLTKYQNGIVIVTGPTGSGKSTTLASMLNEINSSTSKHIITIEDPIEYIYECKKSMVSQRQLGVDTTSFADGIKYALRQDPDVIFIGEIRDKETMEAALKASETGHLVFATLHTNDAVQTINRIINMFDENNRELARKQIAETLRATIAQKLVYSNDHQKRYPACEIMIVTSTIKDYILKNDMDEIYKLISQNGSDGMMSLNQSLAELVSNGYITQEEAMEHSANQNELSKIFKGVY